ncbi:conserved protein of unknown function [Paraburkholderia kururiensis]
MAANSASVSSSRTGAARLRESAAANRALLDEQGTVPMVRLSSLGYAVGKEARIAAPGGGEFVKPAGTDAYLAMRYDAASGTTRYALIEADANTGLPKGYAAIDPHTGLAAIGAGARGPIFPIAGGSRDEDENEAHEPQALPTPSSPPFDTAAGREELSRAITLLSTANAAEVKLSARDIAYVLGYERAPFFRRSADTVRRVMPRMKRCDERVKDVVSHLHERAVWEHDEWGQRNALSDWVGALTPQQRAGLHVVHEASGGPAWTRAFKIATRDGEHETSFDAGHMLNVPADVLAALPQQAREALQTRRERWNALGVTSGPEAEEFVEAHFERESFDADSDEMPTEMAALVEMYPEAAQIVERLYAQGATLHLVRCSQTPDAVLDAIRHVATHSQHKFVTTWLPGLVRAGARPKVLESDLERLREESGKQLGRALEKAGPQARDGFRGAVLAQMSSDALADDEDFDTPINLIRDFSSDVLSVSASGGEHDARTQADVARLDTLLADTFGREYALRRLSADDANRTSEGARAILTSLAVMAPTVEVVQDALHMGGFAKFLAASADDVMAEGAELSALRGAGMSNDEMRKRIATLAPVAVLALFAANSIDEVSHTVGDHAGGALFSTGAVMLSAATGLMSVKYFADNYRKLEREGKLPERIVLDAATREQLDALAAENPSPEELARIVDAALEQCGTDGTERERIVAQMRQLDSPQAIESLLNQSAPAGRLEAWRAGMKEAMGVNPARLGLTLGTYSAPAMGALLGPLFLHVPIAYAAAGSYETFMGVLTIWLHNLTFGARWRHAVDRKAQAEIEGPGDAQ